MPIIQGPDLVEIPLNSLPGLEDIPAGQSVLGFPKPTTHVPPRDPDFVFDKDMVRPLLAWLNYGEPDGFLIYGERGCGKSSTIRQLHAYTNRPLFEVNGYETLEFEDMLGTKEIVDGDTVTMDGPLLLAARFGAPLLIEEFDRLRPGASVSLNAVLDGYPIVNPLNGGEKVIPSPGFGIAMTGNSSGGGDTTGDYVTANVQDQSTLDRCWVVQARYPVPDVELAALRKKVDESITDEQLMQSIRFANDVRNLYAKTTSGLSKHATPDLAAVMETTVSRRTLPRLWNIATMMAGVSKPMSYALQLSLTNRCSPSCAEALMRLADAHFADGV
jgi:cobaltochelatase CobS